MTTQTRANHPGYSHLPVELERYDSLAELALDLR